MDQSVDFAIKQPYYTGPLGLLLELIEANHLPIDQIQLANITGQYLVHIETLELDNDQLNDFLRVAGSLILIKSQYLSLASSNEIDDSDLDESADSDTLANQLRVYQRWQPSFSWLAKQFGRPSFATPKHNADARSATIQLDIAKITGVQQKIARIAQARAQLINRPKLILKALPIVARLRRLNVQLSQAGQLSLGDIIQSSDDKPTKIADFLAVLTLIDKGKLRYQDSNQELVWIN